MNEIMTNPIGVSLGLLGIILSFYFYFKGTNKSRPLYGLREMTVNRVAHPSIQIYFENERIDNFNILRWTVWNGGKRTILNGEIPNDDKLKPRVVLDSSYKVLELKSYNVIDNQVLEKELRFENNIIYLDFEYLKKNDGVCGEVYFSQVDEEKHDVKLLGNFKNDDEKIQKGDIENTSRFEDLFHLFTVLMVIFIIPFMLSDLFKLTQAKNLFNYFKFGFVSFVSLFLYYSIFKILIPQLVTGWTKKMPKVFIHFLDTGNL